MAGFFSNLISKITSVFKSKDLDENINNFQIKIDTIINDLLLPYTNPDAEIAKNDRFRDMINLLDPNKCNKIAMTLSSNLEKNYTKIQLEEFSNSILKLSFAIFVNSAFLFLDAMNCLIVSFGLWV